MDDKTLLKRLIDLESSNGLLQHDFEKQSDAILYLTRRLEAMEKALEKTRFQLENIETQRSTTSPADEKPPHY